MAQKVSEVMNHEVLRFDRDAPVPSALALLLRMGLTTAPVVDGNGHPVGVVSLRLLVQAEAGTKVGAVMVTPALVAGPETSLLDAARLLDVANLHHLAVVDEHQGMVGFVSSLDLLRGIIGAPARHPDSFAHWDKETGAAFSNDRPLDPDHIGGTPHAAGLVVIVRGGAGRPERVVWAETTLDIKHWLFVYFDASEGLCLSADLSAGGAALRYRYAQIDDWRVREEAAFSVRERAQLAIDRERTGPGSG